MYPNQGHAVSGAIIGASAGMVPMDGGYNTAQDKIPSVIEQLNIQEKTIVGVHGMFDQLVDRLMPILGPMPPNPPMGASGTAPTPTNLSQRIPIHTRGIEMLAQRIQELLVRIEL